LVSFLFAGLLLTVPPCPAICKNGGGGACPPSCPMMSAPLSEHTITSPCSGGNLLSTNGKLKKKSFYAKGVHRPVTQMAGIIRLRRQKAKHTCPTRWRPQLP